MTTKQHLASFILALLFSGHSFGQTTKDSAPNGSDGPAVNSWSFSLVVDGYVVPHSEFYISPTFAANRDWLHLEARYNYEDQQTGSLWVGYNFSTGQKLVLEVTPMIGSVFGKTIGVAPGFQVSLSYKRITFSSTGEYVFDTKHHNGSFFYSWPQLTYSPVDWFHAGLVAQRTKAYNTSLDTQRGLLVGFSHKKIQFTTYIFNAGWTDPTIVFEAGVNF